MRMIFFDRDIELADTVPVDLTRRDQVGLEQPAHRQRTADLRGRGRLVSWREHVVGSQRQ